MCVTSPVVVAGTALQLVDRETGTEKEKKVGDFLPYFSYRTFGSNTGYGRREWREAHLPLLKCLTTMVQQSQALCRPIAKLI